mmetsp:Transcript_37012/g.88670  ORF Transcript_37012/g.88670 Transcript_37012/m.88670 type:complete len:228 (+) Transcript_37012:477-1160(+)
MGCLRSCRWQIAQSLMLLQILAAVVEGLLFATDLLQRLCEGHGHVRHARPPGWLAVRTGLDPPAALLDQPAAGGGPGEARKAARLEKEEDLLLAEIAQGKDACEDEEGEAAKREDVGLAVGRQATKHFGSSPHDGAAHGSAVLCQDSRKAKVQELCPQTVVAARVPLHDDIGALQISMNDGRLSGVKVGHRPADVTDGFELDRHCHWAVWQTALKNELLEAWTSNPL